MNEGFTPFSRWAPRTPLYWALRPQKALERWLDPPMPLSVRVQPSTGPLAGREFLVWWSYDPRQWGERLMLTFETGTMVRDFDSRWRVLAAALWRMIRKDPSVTFHEVPTELGDGAVPELSPEVFVFARAKGAANALLPNPYLLQKRAKMPRALPWEAKRDVLYFRGALTGAPDLDENGRVALCRAAKDLPDTLCLLSRLNRRHPHYEALDREGLVGQRVPIPAMNKYRYQVDADGHTTSWDRYLWIGTFGCVPILFEPRWEECWHGELVEGENCLHADRHTLGAVLHRLRTDQALARRLAEGATRLATTRLSPEGAQAMFEAAWRAYPAKAGLAGVS